MSTMYEVMKEDGAKQFLDKIKRKTGGSSNTKNSYAVALARFNDFLKPRGYTLKSVISPLATNQLNVYTLLDDFVAYMTDNYPKMSGKTVKVYMAGIRSYLQSHDEDIEISPIKFKKKVSMPAIYRTKEEAIDASDIREILLHTNNKKLKTYLLMLGSGGMRTIECCNIRYGDIELDINKITIREDTKTKTERYTFISDEATKFLREWLVWKYRKHKKIDDEDMVFGRRDTVARHIYQRLWLEFNKVLSVVAKDSRKRNGQRRKITLNSFRRFVKTTTSDHASSDYSEWLIGHANSSYWTKREEEQSEIYKTKCMPYMTFLDYTTLDARGKSIEAKLDQKDQQIF
jgi:integrase